ncbi:MAG: hypothetical protein FJ146_01270 [Deltaproteobacteria bacterium]|nr:hypothetical protein [Deltaproteobacteria bacterium]
MQHSDSEHYPNAYCVKCGTETETKGKHTVLLANQTRALKGLCAHCTSEVYRIMPKIKAATATAPLTGAEKRHYPDAFCLKCQAHTPTKNAHTVILDNRSRAVTGKCGHCSHDVYRIIGPASVPTLSATTKDTVGNHSKASKTPGLALPVRANLRLIKSPETTKTSLSGIYHSAWTPRLLIGLIVVGMFAIGLMAMNQL